MDTQNIVPCEVCGTEATRFYQNDLALCELHAAQYEGEADYQNERQQEEVALDNE